MHTLETIIKLSEALTSLSTLNEEDVFKHLDSCLVSPEKIGDFEDGLEWFNVSKQLSLHKDLKGKIVVLDFFTYCCINCMHILPDLKELEEKFSIANGLVVIGVHSAKFDNEKDSQNIQAALDRYNITHPVINDAEGIKWKELCIPCWPTLVILGPDSEAILLLIGEGHKKTLNSFISSTLKYFSNKLSNHELPLSLERIPPRVLRFPGKITYCSLSKKIAISDSGNHRIIIVDYQSESVQFVIGGNNSGFVDGNFEETRFNSPQGLCFTSLQQNILYVADTGNHAIREINLNDKYVKTVAGNGVQGCVRSPGEIPSIGDSLASPWDLCEIPSLHLPDTDPPLYSEPIILIAMAGVHQLWAYFPKKTSWWRQREYEKGICAPLAGTGKEENRNNFYPHSAAFAQPSGVCWVGSPFHSVFVADSESSSIRRIHIQRGRVTAVVGGDRSPFNLFCFGDQDGTSYDVRLQHPLAVSWDPQRSQLLVADTYNHKIKSVDPEKLTCKTLIGFNEENIKLFEPSGLCIIDDLLYIADTNNHAIKIWDLSRNNLVKELTLVIPQLRSKEIKPINADFEDSIIINHQGCELNIYFEPIFSEGVHLSSGPSRWTLSLPTNCESWSIKTNLNGLLNEKIEMNIPKTNSSEIIYISLQIFGCTDKNLCFSQKLQFKITLNFHPEGPKILSHVLKPLIKYEPKIDNLSK